MYGDIQVSSAFAVNDSAIPNSIAAVVMMHLLNKFPLIVTLSLSGFYVEFAPQGHLNTPHRRQY